MATNRDSRYFKWVDGVPHPVKDPITPKTMRTLNESAMSTPYDPLTDENGQTLSSEFEFRTSSGEWMTCAEVATIKRARKAAQGDYEALRQIEDRILGKPKQSIESVQVTGTFQDWIASLASQPETFITVDDPAPVAEHHVIKISQAESVPISTVSTNQEDLDWL